MTTIIFTPGIHYFEDLWQRPQQLAVEWAKSGHEVVFINNKNRIVDISYSISELSPEKCRALYEDNLSECVKNRGVLILDRVAFIRDPNGAAVNVLAEYMNYLSEVFSITNRHFWITNVPDLTDVILKAKDKWDYEVYYDCVDDMKAFYASQQVSDMESRLISGADGIVTTSKTLFVEKGLTAKKIVIVPNAGSDGWGRKNCAPDLESIPRPRIGYVGAIARWLDQDLVINLAKRNPAWNFIFIGKSYVDTTQMEQHSNIHFLGTKEHSELPKYIGHFDTGIIPFEESELIINTNPIKYFEYRSLSLPTVASIMPELIDMDGCLLCKSIEQWEESIQQSIDLELSNITVPTWRDRAKEIMSFMLGEKGLDYESTVKEIVRQYQPASESSQLFYMLYCHALSHIDPLSAFQLPPNWEAYAEWYGKVAVLRNDFQLAENVLHVILPDISVWGTLTSSGYLALCAWKTAMIREAKIYFEEEMQCNPRFAEEMANLLHDIEEFQSAFLLYSRVFNDYNRFLRMETVQRCVDILSKYGKGAMASTMLRLHGA